MQAPIIPGSFPVGYCWPSSPQQFNEDQSEINHVDVPDNITGVAFGPVEPGAQYLLWWNSTDKTLYEWDTNLGQRVSLYPFNPGFTYWVEMTPDQISKIGNSTGAAFIPGAENRTGPFWEIDHNYDGRSPMGVGVIPGMVPATSIALSGIEGSGSHLQIGTEVGPHLHTITYPRQAQGGGTELFNEWHEGGGGVLATKIYDTDLNDVTGQTEIPIVHPVRGCYLIKRTLRIYLTP